VVARPRWGVAQRASGRFPEGDWADPRASVNRSRVNRFFCSWRP